MAEPVDAKVSKTFALAGVRVRVPPSASSFFIPGDPFVMRFAAVVHKDPDSCYGVTVPGLPGCFSAGDTLDEAVESASEAIACHVEGMLLDGEQVPEQPTIEELRARSGVEDGTWVVVNAPPGL